MVVKDRDVFSILRSPAEDNAKLVIDPNGIVAREITDQGFEAIAWRGTQVLELRGRLSHAQFTSRSLKEIRRKAFGTGSIEDGLFGFTFKAFYHVALLILSSSLCISA